MATKQQNKIWLNILVDLVCSFIMQLLDLKELEKESSERGIPIIGNKKGKWLLDKVKELKPKKILELGTASGYSGIILGSEKGKLTTIEMDSKIAGEAEKNFKKFNINAKITIGNANLEIKNIKEKFDLIYIDHAKKDYIKILDNCIDLLNKNGVIIADNIFFEGCKNFKEKILEDKRLKTEIVDIEDGLSYSKMIEKV